MNKAWIRVFIATFFEILWVIGVKHAFDFWTWSGTIIAIILSNYYLVTAGKKLPVGSVYAVFVGLGAAGAVFAEMAFFGEPLDFGKIFFIALLLIGVIGLQLSESKEQERTEN